MKILQLIDEPWDSGITAYALQVAALLAQHGEKVSVGVLKGKKPETLARAQGLHTQSYDSLWGLRKILVGESWDVINAHTGRTHTWSALFRSDVPIVRTRGDARPVSIHALSRFIYRRTEAIVSASDHICQQYQRELGLSDEKLETIYPSVQPDAAILPPPKNVVGVLGRLDPVKGHAIFLEAAVRVLAEIPDTQFLVAGKEAGVSIDILKNQARELGIASSVAFLGFQPSVLEFMRRCGLGVIPSLGSEEISRACLEWMAVGRPVVGTLVGSLPELIDPEETGLLVSAGDGALLGGAMLKVLKNRTLLETWGRNAHAVVQRKFGPAIQLEKTLDVYHRAIDRFKKNHG
jgi:glycosyltransferase involved in cell wall biosynthesis